MRGQGQMTYTCSVDGMTLRADSEEELAQQYKEHMQTQHDKSVSDEQARQAVHEKMQMKGQERY